jgi:hypothetical protein
MKPYSLTTKRQQELRLRLSLDFVKTQGVFDFKAITDGEAGAVNQSNAVNDTVYFLRENGLVHEVDGKPFITSKGIRLLQALHLVARPSNLDSSGARQQ